MDKIDWTRENILYIANECPKDSNTPNERKMREIIEPWLTAVFQSEHLSLLLGTGITTGICYEAGVSPQAMQHIQFSILNDEIHKHAQNQAEKSARGKANLEDDLKSAIELLKGLDILGDIQAYVLEQEINEHLIELLKNLVKNEQQVLQSPKGAEAISLLKKFLISFSSRTATRDRLHIFTTNYDRFIEYALDNAGIYTLDRFVGKLNPILRMHKMELDYHYNPPGIRGEPRYVEGVVRYTKLHGSLDWRFNGGEISRIPLPFGLGDCMDLFSKPYETQVIYPNSAKGIDTAYFPYSELFRDFSTATCRPNSVLVVYGYGFGDSHINSIISDMMTVPSTHLVIISFDLADGRLQRFVERCNPSQITLLIGKHYGNIRILVENYLPKAAIDRITERQSRIVEKRHKDSPNNNQGAPEQDE